MLSEEEVIHIIKLNPFLFSDIFSYRHVNNIYLDTFEKQNYYNSVEGLSSRIKVRIRWYGPLFGAIEKAVLEIKVKKNHLNTKLLYKLQPFQFERGFSIETIQNVLETSEIPDLLKLNLQTFEATLVNRYCRCYFLCANKVFRITLDKNLEYYSVYPTENFFFNYVNEEGIFVLEIKADDSEKTPISQVSNHFPFRMTKNSKYTSGIDLLKM